MSKFTSWKTQNCRIFVLKSTSCGYWISKVLMINATKKRFSTLNLWFCELHFIKFYDFWHKIINCRKNTKVHHIRLRRIIVLAPRIPRFKGLGMRNLQYWVRTFHKSHNTVTNHNCILCVVRILMKQTLSWPKIFLIFVQIYWWPPTSLDFGLVFYTLWISSCIKYPLH